MQLFYNSEIKSNDKTFFLEGNFSNAEITSKARIEF